MNGEPTFDPRRKAAIRELVVATAADGRYGRVRKHTALVVALVLVALGISGGSVAYALGTGILAPAAPTPAPTATPTPTPTPSATPTTPPPTPTQAPVAENPGDPSTWRIDFDHIGPVTLGRSLPEVKAELSAFADDTDPKCLPSSLYLLLPDRVSLRMLDDTDFTPTAQTIELLGHPGNQVSLSPKTAEGIGLGSTADELFATYPDLVKTFVYSETSVQYTLSRSDGARIVFDVIEGEVQVIDIGADAVIPSERCPL
jgi:hypothetical protein